MKEIWISPKLNSSQSYSRNLYKVIQLEHESSGFTSLKTEHINLPKFTLISGLVWLFIWMEKTMGKSSVYKVPRGGILSACVLGPWKGSLKFRLEKIMVPAVQALCFCMHLYTHTHTLILELWELSVQDIIETRIIRQVRWIILHLHELL